MQITFDTENLSPMEKKVLQLLSLGELVSAATVGSAVNTAAKKATAPKAEAAPKIAAVPDPEPEEVPADSDAAGPTMDDAVNLATELVSAGKAKVVKFVLAQLKADRVSKLTDDSVAPFVTALTTNLAETVAAQQAEDEGLV